MISEQVKELRNLADYFQRQNRDYYTAPALSEAADTIESLYAKLQAVNEEREKEDHNGDILSETLEWINKRIGTKLKLEAMTNDEVYEFGHRKSIETFQEVRLYIETEIAEQKEKRSAEDCGGWIKCKVRLPEEGKEVLLQDYYGNREIGRFGHNEDYKEGFYNGDWFSTANNYLTWHELPEPYHEP